MKTVSVLLDGEEVELTFVDQPSTVGKVSCFSLHVIKVKHEGVAFSNRNRCLLSSSKSLAEATRLP